MDVKSFGSISWTSGTLDSATIATLVLVEILAFFISVLAFENGSSSLVSVSYLLMALIIASMSPSVLSCFLMCDARARLLMMPLLRSLLIAMSWSRILWTSLVRFVMAFVRGVF